MSWERETARRPCFCGRGTIVIESASDSWGRSEYDERMECHEGDKKFVYARVEVGTIGRITWSIAPLGSAGKRRRWSNNEGTRLPPPPPENASGCHSSRGWR